MKMRSCNVFGEHGAGSRSMRATYEYDEHAKHLQHKPTVARDAGIVLEQFSLRAADIRRNVDGIRVDALHSFSLLGHHLRKLGEDLAELCDG